MPLRKLLIAATYSVLLVLSGQTGVHAANWTVCASGCNYTSINGAITNINTVSGDTVTVSGGPYAESINFSGKNITLVASGAVTLPGTGGNAPVVTFNGGETSSAVLEGFTIDNSSAINTLSRGIVITSGSAPTIRNVTITGNLMQNCTEDANVCGGGGVFINGGSATFEGCTINSNTATNRAGGGIYAKALSAPLTITNTTFTSNTTSAYGGAIYLYLNGAQATTVTSSTFTSNQISATGGGGAIYSNGSRLVVNGTSGARSNFTSNSSLSSRHGGAIYLTGPTASADISYATFTTNVASGGQGGAIYVTGSTEALPLNVSNSEFLNQGTTGTKPQAGGAIALVTVTNKSVISSSLMTGNTVSTTGGGCIYANAAPVELNSVTATGNSAGAAGGCIFATASPVTLNNTTLGATGAGNGNTSTGTGGGLYATGAASTVSITGGSIANNGATLGAGVYLTGITATSTISSASISSNTNTSTHGGGVWTASPLTISNSTINGNTSVQDGGGIFLSNVATATVNVTGGTISNNIGRQGVGVFASANSSLTLTGVTINGNATNSTTAYGGGVYAVGSSLTVDKCYIQGNTSSYSGGGIYSTAATATIKNSTITGNKVTAASLNTGGGVFVGGTTNNIFNCTIAKNESVGAGGGLRSNAGTTTVQNSIFWGNTAPAPKEISPTGMAGVTYCDVDGGYTGGGAGNQNINPNFVNYPAAAAPTTAGDFHLNAGSGVINLGVDNANTPADDIDGDGRPQNGVTDIGSDEYLVNTPPIGGYTADDVIPSAQISQATNGSGVMTITWKGKDGESHNVTLKTFQYSVDGGSTWNAPTNGDTSASLSSGWNNNGGAKWSTATSFAAATAHSFTFNTKHADVSGMDSVDQSDVRVRFTLNDNKADSAAPATSENFRVDNVIPTATIASGVYDPAADTLVITGANFTSIATAGTDIKSYVDWTKFVWDINGDDATTANITFVLGDITSLTVTNDTTLTLVFTGAKGTAIEATAGYGPLGGNDTLDVTAGFIKDYFGNAATTDGVADGALTIDNMVSGTVYTDEGVTNIGVGKTVHLLINGADAGTGVTDANGAYIINAVINPGDAILVYIDNDGTYKGTTVTVVNGAAPTSLNIYAGYIMTRNDNGGSLSNTNMSTAKGGSADTDIYYSVAGSALTVSGATLYVPSGHTYAPGGNVITPTMKTIGDFSGGTGSITISGNLTIAGGTYTATNGTTTVSGNIALSGGSFAHNSGSVVLSGTSQTISGSFTFNNFTKTVAAAATLTFGAGSTTGFDGAVTLQGASGQLLSLVSSSVGTKWKFRMNLGASKTINYVSVKDSDASSSNGAYRPISPTNSTDAGNNLDWFTLDTLTAKAMIVYSSSAAPGKNYPKSRMWSSGSWTGEATLPPVTATYYPKNVVVKTKPAGSNERIAAVRDSLNAFFLYSTQGGDWTNDLSGITLPANNYRSFDMAYEKTSGRAILVYNTSAAASSLKYRIWNGTAWGAETALYTPGTITTGTVYWVKLESKPGTNEIMLAWACSNRRLGAAVWNGDTSTWSIKASALTTNLFSPNNWQGFDVAYETGTKRVMIAYTNNLVETPKYYTYLEGTWSTELTAPAFAGAGVSAGEHLRLIADPRAGSNKIVMGVGKTGSWFMVGYWDGNAWDATPITLSASYATASYGGRAFDLAWESKSGRVMAVYGKTGFQRGHYSIWDSQTAWSSGNWSTEITMPAGATNPTWVQLVPDPGSNEILCGITDNWALDLNIHQWNGSIWMKRQEFTVNVSGTGGENFMLSYRTDAIPVAVITSPVNFQSLSGTTYTVSGAASDDYGVYKVEVHIQRDTTPSTHWTGAQWTTDEHWLRATNTTAWSYVWQLPPDHGTYTYTIIARATDNTGQLSNESTPVTGVKVYTIPDPLTVYRNTAVVDSSTQITANAWYSGDGNADSSTKFETGPSSTGPWTDKGSLSTVTSDQEYFIRQKAISGLTAGTIYYIRITHTDPDGVTGTNPEVLGPYTTKTNGTTTRAITAVVDDCSQVTVSATFDNDGNNNGTTAFHYSTDGTAWDPAPGCGAVAGASPRECAVTGLVANTIYFFKATFSDADGISGLNPIATPDPSPYRTLATCLTRGTTVGTLSVDNSNCRQLSVRAAYTGDQDADGSTLVEFKKTADSTWSNACTAVTGGSPRTCYVTDIAGLSASTSYDLRVTWTDADGVSGTNPQSSTVSTPACGSADVFPPTLTLFRPMDGATVSGNATYPVRIEITAYDRHGLNTSSVKAIIDGTEYATTANPNVSGNYYYDWIPATTGYHTVQAKGADTAGNFGFSSTFKVYVNSITIDGSGLFSGDGKLLVRENTSQLCFDCHGGIQTHSSQNLSPKYGNWAIDCRTCHTPHNTANIFLVRPVIKTPNSGEKTIDFRNTTGQADYSYATKTTPGNGPCEVCHTKTRNGDDSGRYRNTGTGPGPKGDSHFTDQRCTDCHKHTQGFSPISAGNISCGTCHPDRWTAMNATTNEYHMYMQNSDTTAITGGIGTGSKYPNKDQFLAGDAESDHRRCLMCHADMDVWHYKNNPNTPGVSYNLRVSISVAPDKADSSTFTNKDFDGTRTDGGLCFSCHRNQQTKNTAKMKNSGTVNTPAWDLDEFKAGTHNYSVPVNFKADNSIFNATCVKCHTDTMVKDYQSSTYRVGAHSGTTRSYLSNINKNSTTVETTYNSLEENMCYQCHSMSTEGPDNYNPNGWNGVAAGDGKDGYNVQTMNKKAQRMKFLFSKDSSHPIDGAPPYDSINGLNQAAGRHRVDEGVNDTLTPSGVQVADWNPAATRHVECMDCHNPHATNATPRNMTTWKANPYHATTTDYGNGLGLGIMSGYQVVEGSFGGQIGGANYGTWGVIPTYTAGAGGVAPTSFTKVTNMNSDNMIYQLCFKCHSLYAYGATPPQIPWGTSAYNAGAGDSWGGYPNNTNHDWTPGPESDLSVDFNPYNLGMHPVNRRGRNQPAPHLSTNWPFFNGGAGNQAGSNWWVTAAAPGSSGTVNYNAATKVVTIAAGNNFPTYYMQPGWKIQFTLNRPTAPTAGNTATYWYEIKTVDSATQLTLVSGPAANQTGVMFNISAGLGWTFVPPYGPWSTLACGDCHQSGDKNDPAGPHGSDNPWILREINYSAAVDNDLNGSIVDAVDYINTSTGISGDETGWVATNTICYSCHRRDVYGWTAKNNGSNSNEANTPGGTVSRATYSRFNSHVPGGEEDPKFNAFNIWCLSCHGGETANGSGTGIGAIHGSNRGTGTAGGTTQLGMRLRNGAGVGGHTMTAGGGSCWTKVPNNDSVSSCVVTHTGSGYTSTYSYTTVD